MRALRDEVLEYCNRQAHIIVVGNKVDLEERRQVKKEIAETLVEIDWEHGFVEASAKNNINVLQVSTQISFGIWIEQTNERTNKQTKTRANNHASLLDGGRLQSPLLRVRTIPPSLGHIPANIQSKFEYEASS